MNKKEKSAEGLVYCGSWQQLLEAASWPGQWRYGMMSIAGDALNGVGLWIARRERKQERDDAAVRSVLTAVNTTRRYLARRERGEPIDREAQAELVELWTTASVHVRRTDPDLAMRLQDKAEYWTNPENWTEEEITSNGIQIDDIAEEGRRLLSAA